MSILPEWTSVLPEELRDLPHVADSKDLTDFKKRVAFDAAARGTSLRIPSSEAGPEDWAEFTEKLTTKVPNLVPVPGDDADDDTYKAAFNKLGRPVDAEGYQLAEGKEFSGDLASLKGYAHNAGMTVRQFRALAEQMEAGTQGGRQEQLEALNNGYKTLKTEWGQAYDDRMALAEKVLAGAPPYILEAFKNGTLPAEQVRYFHSIAELGKEMPSMVDQETKSSGKMTPEEANERLRELERNNKNMKPSDPDWASYLDKRVKLIGMASGLPAENY